MATILQIQKQLLSLGFDPKGLDGIAGKNTRQSLIDFQKSKCLPPTGLADDPTISALFDQLPSASPSFFDRLRGTALFPRLSESQQQGMQVLLNALQRHGVTGAAAAYILAGVYHETGTRMVPVREGFATSDAAAVAAVKKLFDQGRIRVNYAVPVGGVSYFGRGRIQNTWSYNYEALEKRFGLPFVKQPDLLLDSEIDAEVTVVGHLEGIWTKGKHKLSNYINETKTDFVGARRIVNGTDKAQKIAGYSKAFLTALEA